MKNINKIKCHSKPPHCLVSGAPQGCNAGSDDNDLESSTLAVSQQQQQRHAWKTLNQVQGDGLFYNNGFTLIELLVVVLIIGILAAVALPQYQRAVDKSRFMKMVQVVYGVKRAQETYYLANGNYAADLTALDIDYTGGCQPSPDGPNMFVCPDGFYMDLELAWGLPTGAFSVTFCPDHNTNFRECGNNAIASFRIYFDHNRYEHLRGKSSCIGNTPRGETICKSLQSMQ